MPLDAPVTMATRCGCWPAGSRLRRDLRFAGLGQQLFGGFEERAVLRGVAAAPLSGLLGEAIPELGLLDGELDALVRRRVTEDVHRVFAALDPAQVLLELLPEQNYALVG